MLGHLIINNHDIAPPMRELDVSGLVRHEGTNILRWLPGVDALKGNVPVLILEWKK